jgi:hypothetical protein
MTRSRAGAFRPLLFVGALSLLACSGDPLLPTPPRLEVVVAGGNNQFGVAGEALSDPLSVVVRRIDTGAPESGISVHWTVEEGDASLLGGGVSTTADDGTASQHLRLGTVVGPVLIRAAAANREGVETSFSVHLIARPEVTSLSKAQARGGDTLTVTGRNFSSVPAHNVVLFSGIRGRTLASAPEELRVEVPACLPRRTVDVTAQLGTHVSQSVPLDVDDAGARTELAIGDWLDVSDDEGLTCLHLSGSGGAGYLAVVTSSSSVGAARYDYFLRGLSSLGEMPPPGSGADRLRTVPPPSPGFGERFEADLRRLETSLVAAREPSAPSLAPAPAPTRVPAVGDRQTFQVLNAEGGFDQVEAVVRHVGLESVLYLDETAPGDGFTEADLASLTAQFDGVVHPAVTGAFGNTSDLDENDRVVILFSPAVNRLTPRGADGFIGGFFYGVDLLDREGSNQGEVFYALVPDPGGAFSDPRSKSLVMNVMPAILAHELQHMVHFNERVLVLGAENTEALWLSEGLAQMAEEIVARAYYDLDEVTKGDRFRSGNLTRARRYMAAPADISLIVATGQGSLGERGAAWLHTLYLWDSWGGADALRRLTKSTRTGLENITAVTGSTWEELFADWAAALYLDERASEPYPFEYPSVDLRGLLATSTGSYPLAPEVVGSTDFTRAGSLWSSSMTHYIVVPPNSGSVALRLGGEAGGNLPNDASLRLRIVRLF